MTRTARWAPWIIVGLYLLGAIAANGLLIAAHKSFADGDITGPALTVMAAAFALIAALLVRRQPRNIIGWLLATLALMIGVLPTGDSYAVYRLTHGSGPTLAVRLAAWVNGWSWFGFVTLLLVFLPLLFPTGRPVSKRWRIAAWTGGGAGAVMVLMGMVADKVETQELRGVWLDNPIGIPGFPGPEQSPIAGPLFVLLILSALAALVSLVVRFVRSRGEERAQLKWFLLAVCFVPVSLVLENQFLGQVAFVILLIGLPTSIGIALLKYRLYDIDRVISRTISYALVTGALAAAYVGLVLVLQIVTRWFTNGSDLAVAASVLIVAAAFRPVRRRVQNAVDHRFNRRRYDAARTIEAFTARLRDEIDIDALGAELSGVVRDAMHPAHVSLWTRERR